MHRSLPAVLVPLLACVLVACDRTALGWPGSEDERAQRTRELADYKRAHAVDLGERFVRRLDRDRFVARVRASRVLWLGDRHVDRTLHAAWREWLAALRADGVRLAFALEAIGVEDDALVADHLAGRIDGAELRAQVRTRWPGSWLEPGDVDASAYRALIADARRASEPVVGLEPAPRLPLAQRDAAIAARVAALARALPDRVLVVVVGHAHLLGDGDVVARSGAVGIVVAPALNAALRRARDALPLRGDEWFLESDAGVWFPAWLR